MSQFNNNLAFVFPGQGSQSVGMLAEFAGAYAEVAQVFDEASEVLGQDLWQLTRDGPEEKLNLTENTQPVMLCAAVAAWRIWSGQSGVRPAWMAGHSLGEYSALVCSGALNFADAVRLVRERARLMQEAVPPGIGAMAAILGLEDSQVVEICAATSGDKILSPVNFNAPGQVVIAGHAEAVDEAIGAAKASGARRAVMLPVSVPSHCALMQSAAEQFDPFLQATPVQAPEIPVVHNADVASHAAPEVIRAVLKKQIHSPVRWADSIRFMNQQGVEYFVECGPGKVLSGMNKRIVRDCSCLPITDVASLEKAMEMTA